MDDAALPPPTSGLFLEVSFRRLLASCEAVAAGDARGRPDLAVGWETSPVFHHVGVVGRGGRVAAAARRRAASVPPRAPFPFSLQYVDTLQEQLADLEAAEKR